MVQLRKGFSREWFWRFGVVVALYGALLWAFLVTGRLDFNRWDNFEYHSPLLIETHSQLLHGCLPVWNRHQHLGEPLLGNGQPSVFYFPYTIQLGLMRLLHIPDSSFTLGIFLLHLPLMGLGVYQLMRSLRVRPSFAFMTAVNISTAGYLVAYPSVWIFVSPVLAWIPWILLGVVKIQLPDREQRLGFCLAALGLAAVGLIGHPQFTVYTWLLVGLFGFWQVWDSQLDFTKAFVRFATALLAGGLLSAPAVLPVLYLLPYSARSTGFSMEEFVAASVNVESLWGFFLPVYRSGAGALGGDAAVLCHMGTWVPLALLGAGLVYGSYSWRQLPFKSADGRGSFYACTSVGLLFLLFALGKAGLIYPLTNWVPVWSSFRWPHKFLPYAQLGLGVAAGLGLEVIVAYAGQVKQVWHVRLVVISCLVLILGVFLLQGTAFISTPSGMLSVIAAGVCLAGFWQIHHSIGRCLLICAAVAVSFATVGLTQQRNMKSYAEPYASIGVAELGIDTSHYILPLSHHAWGRKQPGSMQSHALFHAATMNGYLSATGVTTGVAPQWYLEWLPSTPWGLLSPDAAVTLLKGSYLSALGIKYLAVSDQDQIMSRVVAARSDVQRVGICDGVSVYAFKSAAPLVYFASGLAEVSDFGNVFFSGQQWTGTAIVEEPSRVLPLAQTGVVCEAKFMEGGRVYVEIDAPEGGFLVINQTYFPQWKAKIDGAPTSLVRTNGLVQGLMVPPGSRRVELRWQSAGLRHGLILAACGLLVLVGRFSSEFGLMRGFGTGRRLR